MRQSLEKKQTYSKEGYLEMEEHNEYRSEYYDGEIFAMAGGTYKHSAICSNLHRRIGNLLDGKSCMIFDSNLKLAIPRLSAFVYPDVMIVCGQIEFFENQQDIIRNPILIVEVLSPSTELFDRGKKFEYYRALPSLQEYVLIAQESPIVEVFYKQNDRKWMFSAAKGLEETLMLQSLECEIRLTDIYQNVEFSNDHMTGGIHEEGRTD